jgi:putative ABC transport system substrate-binding protein
MAGPSPTDLGFTRDRISSAQVGYSRLAMARAIARHEGVEDASPAKTGANALTLRGLMDGRERPDVARAPQGDGAREHGLRRRELISLLGGAAATPALLWPRAARAQRPAMPVIGLLDSRSPDSLPELLRAFRQGLKETGHVEGENVAIEHRWADNQIDRLPALAAELARRRVAVLAVSGPPAARAAKAATTTIPIAFIVNEDPVRLGLVASLARPGGNLTGINIFNAELVAKRLELLRELVPAATHVAVLVNPANASTAESTLGDVQPAARAMGLQIRVLNASTSRELEAAFATFVRAPPDAIFVGADPFYYGRRVQLANLASRHAIPATYSTRATVEAGGLMSYGSNVLDAWRQLGTYAGRILKGAKPADLPVVQASKFELVINHATARMLGLTVPPTLLAIADEVIE